MAPLAIFPIFLTVGLWFFLLAGIPSLVLFFLAQALLASGGSIGAILGIVVYLFHSFFALLALGLVAPWLFGWYFIAAGLMFGRTGRADRKEAELVATIAAADPSS